MLAHIRTYADFYIQYVGLANCHWQKLLPPLVVFLLQGASSFRQRRPQGKTLTRMKEMDREQRNRIGSMTKERLFLLNERPCCALGS